MAYSVLKKDGKIKDFIQGVKDKREKKKIIKDPGGNIRTMFSEGPRFVQELRKKRQK